MALRTIAAEMFEITGDDIARLNDGDARTLVARLALAELRDQAAPQSAVTAGGHQDAADDGIDVRVELDVPLAAPDFIPRANTGYQVKKPDMPPSDISKEMRPGGVLRSEIGSLADVGGAYIIVSLQGSVTNSALARRRQAMRNALAGHPNADKLLTDFYDRDRLAIWVNSYPGAAAWVRAKIGGPIFGWRPIGRWSNTNTAEDAGYLVSAMACIIDQRSKNREKLSIVDGVDRLRAALAVPGRSTRLIGLSGVGKTRLVQALFERGIGQEALDPALSVYTDYSDDIVPSALEMACRLVESDRRAILIVDNCNPVTHGRLTQICSEKGSAVSLLTVEYDVQDDEPERTEVFRLTNATHALIEEWLERDFTQVSPIDRRRIAEFSDGNFRVARLLAESLLRGQTLGRLRSQDLFQRIFHQRNESNGQLLNDAGVLALLYSFDGEDESPDGELARLATFSRRSVSDLFGSVAELRRRGIIQSRGKWRAVLPQAIANALAAGLLERTPPAEFDLFCARLPPRMLKSLSRRLGYLHDCAEAQAAVARWLEHQGPLANLFAAGETGLSIVYNVAPVAPGAVLARITSELEGPDGSFILSTLNPLRWRWVSLLKSLAYEPAMFVTAANWLARFVAAEPEEHNSDPATGPFKELFYLHLSGTHATPTQRREVVRAFCSSAAPELHRAGILALEGLLHSHHFTSAAEFDFGAQPRDFGWEPKTFGETYEWYNEAIALAVKLSEQLGDAKEVLSHNLRDLWLFAECHDSLERASIRFAEMGGWIEGWIAFRAALRFDGDGMPPEIRARLKKIITLLEPTDLIGRARAVVLTRSSAYDIADSEEDDDPHSAWERTSQAAVDIGRAFASNKALKDFLPEVIHHKSGGRTFEFGRGLAKGADDLGPMWSDMVTAFGAIPAITRSPKVLGGFLTEAHRIAPDLVGRILDAALCHPDLVRLVPYLQANVALDAEGLLRLQTAAREGLVEANDFCSLATGLIANAPEQPLVAMLDALSEREKGIGLALDILHMRFYAAKSEGEPTTHCLLVYGRELLRRYDFTDIQGWRDYGLRTVVKHCLAGPEAVEDAKIVCANVRAALEDYRAWVHDASHLLEGLFKAQPQVALDCFLLDGPLRPNRHLFEFSFADAAPIENMDAVTLCAWADNDGEERYPLLGSALSLFSGKRFGDTTGLSPLFIAVMAKAPNKRQFLGDSLRRLRPTAWSGSLADILEKRKRLLSKLLDDPDPGVQAWLYDTLRQLDVWIAQERQSETEREESFE